MKSQIYIAADHRGVALKAKMIQFLEKLGYPVVDVGAYSDDKPTDYPGLALKVGEQVRQKRNARGILFCMTGIGLSIAVNKIPGVRAGLCHNKETALLSRQHNNANVLVLGAKFVPEKEMYGIIEAWLEEGFEGGRHLRRVNQIKQIEKKFLK